MPLNKAPTGSEGLPAVYGMRPEHIEIADEGVASQVVVLEPTGSETQITLNLGSAQIKAVIKDRVQARPGETILIRPRLDAVHLFDPATGQRLT